MLDMLSQLTGEKPECLGWLALWNQSEAQENDGVNRTISNIHFRSFPPTRTLRCYVYSQEYVGLPSCSILFYHVMKMIFPMMLLCLQFHHHPISIKMNFFQV